MRNFVLPAILVASLALPSAAMAATNNTSTGVVKAIDLKAETVTVDKTVYHFPAKFDLSAIKVGEKVTVTWHAYKKVDVGTKIVAAVDKKPAPKPAPKTTTKTTTTTTTTPKKS
jgi:hypothetical protein